MRRVFWWVFTVGAGAIWVLEKIGTIETAAGVVENRGPIMNGVVAVVSSQYLPVGLFLVGVFALFCLQLGCPPWPTRAKAQEDAAYYNIIERYAGRTADLPINAFYLSGAHKLGSRSIKHLCKRLRKVEIYPIPPDVMPDREWAPFLQRARDVGRPLTTREEALWAFDE